MAYYISKLYHIEILRMKCEFVKDHNNTIWFQYASDIWVRPNMQAVKATEEQEKKVKKINEQMRVRYMDIMQQQSKERQEAGNKLADGIHTMMSHHYDKMKKDVGLDQYSHSSDSFDEESEAVFKQLRPHAKYRLMDLLEGKVKQPKKKLFKSTEMRNQARHKSQTFNSDKIARVNGSFNLK
jgi:hypothetical protein